MLTVARLMVENCPVKLKKKNVTMLSTKNILADDLDWIEKSKGNRFFFFVKYFRWMREKRM